jgi:hypothetical protein
MFKKLFEKTKTIAAINEIEGTVPGASIQKLADEFEDKYFEYQFEQFAEANHLSSEDRTLLMKELLNRIDKNFESIKEQELKPETQAIVMELVEVQKKLNALKAKIEELKATKTDMSQPVIDALNELNLQSIRVGKVLVSLYQGKTAASFKAVIEAIESQLTPAVAKLLRDTYEKLSATRAPEVRVKVESVDEDLLTGIADFFTGAFRKLLGGVSNALTRIESLLGGKMKEAEDDDDHHKIEQNKPAPIVLGLG